MAENETIDGFKRNMAMLVQGLGNERTPFEAEATKLESWKEWVRAASPAVTAAHIDHLYIHVSLQAAKAVLRRKNLTSPADYNAAVKMLKWAIDLCDVNISKGLDTDRIFQTVFDPDWPFWGAVDRPAPPGAAEAAEELQEITAATQAAAAVAPLPEGKMPDSAAPLASPLDVSMSVDSVTAETLGVSFMEQLRVGDFADFSGPPTQGIWVTVSVTELGAYGELRLSMAINGSDFWVSPDSPGLHWAMCGEKSTGQVPTGEAGAAAAASAVPAVDLAVMRAVDEAALVRVLKGPHASFRAALAVGDLVDAKHFGGNGQWYQGLVVEEHPASEDSLSLLQSAARVLGAAEVAAAAPLACLVKVTLLGLGHAADLIVPRYSQHIAPLNWRSGGLRGPSYAPSMPVESEQERDMPPHADPQSVFAVLRPHTYSQYHKGALFVELFNQMWMFKARKTDATVAFGILYQRFQAEVAAKPCKVPFAWVSDTVAMLGKNADILTDIAVEALVRPFWSSVETYLAQLEDDGVRSIPSKESIDALVLGARRILRRVYKTAAEAALKAEQLMLRVAMRCCTSSQLMKRRDGLRVLADAVQISLNRDRYPHGFYACTSYPAGSSVPITEYMRMATSVAIKTSTIVDMISQASLLQDIFVTRHHRELIKISGDLLRVMSGLPESLGPKQVSWLLDAIRHSDTDDIEAAVTVLSDVRSDLPAKVWRQLIQQLVHPAEGPLIDAAPEAAPGGAAAVAAPASGAPPAPCPPLTAYVVRLLASAAQSQLAFPVDLSAEPAYEGSVLVREAIGDLLCIALRLHPAGGLEAMTTQSDTVPAAVADLAASELASMLKCPNLRALRQPVMRTCLRLVQRHVRVHRCLRLLRGVINTYPSRRPAAPTPTPDASGDVSMTVPLQAGGQAADSDLCTADVLGMLEAQSLNQVGSLLLHLQVFGAAARRQATEMGLVTWDSFTGTGTESGATDASDEPGVARSASDAGTEDEDSARVSLEVALESARTIDENDVWISPADLRATAVPSRTLGARGGPHAGSAAVPPPPDWQTADAITLGRRTDRALGLSGRPPVPAGSAPVPVDSGDAISFADGISVMLEYAAFVLLHGERSLSRAEAFALWHEVVAAVLTPSERTRGLAWFTQALLVLAASEGSTFQQHLVAAGGVSAPAPPADAPATPLVFKAEVALALFSECLASPEPVAALCSDAAGFGCWRAFFLYANGKLKNVSHNGFNLSALGTVSIADSTDDSAAYDAAEITKEVVSHFSTALPAPTSIRPGSTGGDFRVLQLELHGLDVLWHLTLNATDATVAAAAIAFLTLIQQRLSDDLAPRIVECRKRYLERCMAYIAGAASPRRGAAAAAGRGSALPWPWSPEPAVTRAASAHAVPSESPSLLRISSSTDPGMLAPALHSEPGRGSRVPGALSVRRVDSGGSATSAPGQAAALLANASRLIERCVSLLDSMLDETDEESDALRVALHEAVARVALYRSVLSAASAQGNADASAMFDAFEGVFRPLVVAAHAAVRSTSHASSSNANVSFDASRDVIASSSSVMPEGSYTTLRVNVLTRIPVPCLPDASSRAEAAGSKEDDDLYGPGATVASASSPAPTAAVSGAAASAPPPLPPAGATAGAKPTAPPTPATFKLGDLRLRVGAAERGGDVRACIAAALGLGSTAKVMVPYGAFSSSGALGAAAKMAAAAAASSGADSAKVLMQELKGWALGRSFSDLGMLDKGFVNVVKAPASAASAALPADKGASCWSPAVTSLLAGNKDVKDCQSAALARWSSVALPTGTGLPPKVAAAFASLEADISGMLQRFHSLPAQILSQSSRYLDTLLSIVDAFAAQASAAADAAKPMGDDDSDSSKQEGSGASAACSVTSKSWKLLCRLPTSQAVALAVATAGVDTPSARVGGSAAVNWDALFPVESPARLYYALLAVLPRLPSMVADSSAFPFPTTTHLEMPPPLAGALRVIGGKDSLVFHVIADGAHKQWRQQALLWAGLDGVAATAGLTAAPLPPVNVASDAATAAAVQEARSRERSFVACGGVAHLVSLLRGLVEGVAGGEPAANIFAQAQSPLHLAAASLALGFLQRHVCAGFLATGPPSPANELALRSKLPFLAACTPRISSSADAALTLDSMEGSSGIALQNLVLSLLDAIVSSAAPAPSRGPAAEHELVRLAISALFLWVPLTMRSGGALWAAASRDAALFVKLSRVLIALVSGSGAGAAAGRLCEKVQPAAVVAIYSLCSTMPSSSGLPAAGLEDKTPSGAPHPHGYILQLMLSHKPTLAAVGPQASAVFYGLTELLLRATVAGESAKAGFGRPLPTALRRALVDILAEIQAAPAVETRVGTRETAECVLKAVRGSAGSSTASADVLLLASAMAKLGASDAAPAAASTAAPIGVTDDGEVLYGPAPPPPAGAVSPKPAEADAPTAGGSPPEVAPLSELETDASALLSDPFFACRALLTHARAPLLRGNSRWNAVGSMHPLYLALGVDVPEPCEADAKAAASAVPPISPLESALQRYATLNGVTPFDGERALVASTPEEFVVGLAPFRDGSSVDTVLVGLMRLATVLVEADPALPRDVVAASSKGDEAITLIRYLYSTCLFAVPEPRIDAVPYVAAAQTASPSAAQPVPEASAALVRVPAIDSSFPKCKTIVSRRAALGLLVALSRRSAVLLEELCELLIREAETLYPTDVIVTSGDAAAGGAASATPSKRGAAAVTTVPVTPAAAAAPGIAKGGLQLSTGWRQDPAGRDDISTAGYVGLRNLGCICYMNSLMQQFFMIEPFRYGILSVPLGETLTEEDRKESTMYQLQRLFGHLELSERRHYDPTPWCHAYKGDDGRPTNTIVQQDAQDYFLTLLDRVELGLRATPRAKLVDQVLAMTLKEARACTGGCGVVKTSEDRTISQTVEVKWGSLGCALDNLTAWEDVTDYQCETCQRRTTVRKRNSVGSVGQALVIHLKRFEMNYETEQTAKLNNRFEFPEELDLWPYSYEALAAELQTTQAAVSDGDAPPIRSREYYQFDLVGVVVHTGSLESGHYYSYIKERGARAQARAAAQPGGGGGAAGGRWLEFNDSVVSEFDPSRLAAECFGGTQVVSQWNAHTKEHVPTELPVVKNAYMLVYERRAPQRIEVPAELVPHLLSGSAPALSQQQTREGEGSKRQRTADAGGAAAAAAPASLWVLPSELVPSDPATARGFIPRSIAADVLADNAAFARQCQQVDLDVAALWHLSLDAVARSPPLLQRCLGRGCEPLPVGSAAAPARPLSLEAAAFTTAPDWLPDFSPPPPPEASRAPPLDLAALVRAGTLFCFHPLGRSTHVEQVPHFAHTLARLVCLHPGAAAMMLQWPASHAASAAPPGIDLFKDAILRNPSAPARAAFGRLIVAAAMTRLLLPGEGDVMRWAPPVKKALPLPRPAAPWTAFVRALFEPVAEREDVMRMWRVWEPYFGALYDAGRGGYGSGLPLVLWDAGAAKPPAAAAAAATAPGSPASATSAVATASALLSAWAEGRDAAAPSALSASWAAPPLPAPPSVHSCAPLKALSLAAFRARYAMVSNFVPIHLADFYLGPRLSPLGTNGTKRGALSGKGNTASWIRAFDLLALLFRTCFSAQAENELGVLPATSLLWGPVSPQRHTSTLIAQYAQGSRPWPAPTLRSVVGTANDVGAARASRDEQVKRSRLAVIIAPSLPQPTLLPAVAHAIPFPSSDDATLIRRIAEATDAHRGKWNPALQQLRTLGYVDHAGKRHTRTSSLLPNDVFPSVTLTRAANMIQDFLPPKDTAQEHDPALPSSITLLELGYTGKESTSHFHKMILYGPALVAAGFGAESETYDALIPSHMGPNPEALAQILAHVVTNDDGMGKQVSTTVKNALQRAEWAETTRPALVVIEPLLLVLDDAAEGRWKDILGTLWHEFELARNAAFAVGGVGVEKAFEISNAIIRLMVLLPRAYNYFAAPLVRKALEEVCRRVVDNAEYGAHRLAPPLAAHLNAVTDSILTGVPVELPPAPPPLPAGSKPDKSLPGRHYAISVLAGPVHVLPFRDELELVWFADVPNAARGYIALQRLHRAAAARSVTDGAAPPPSPLATPLAHIQAPVVADAGASGAASGVSAPSNADTVDD